MIALMPPVVIAVFVHDVSQLVALTVSTAIASFLFLNNIGVTIFQAF